MKTVKTLIVEDSPVFLDRLRESLSRIEGIDVVGEASSLAAARAAVAATDPDVVVLDLWLGDGTGVDLMREMSGDGRHARIIILTSDISPSIRHICLGFGAMEFFNKAGDFEDFERLMTRIGAGLL